MPPDALDTLRQVNANLRSALIRLRPERTHCSTIRARDLSDLLSQLVRAAESLRRPPAQSQRAAVFQKEALEYLCHLEKLKQFLPDLQGRLLAERSRLETARTHVAAAAAWARASEKTL